MIARHCENQGCPKQWVTGLATCLKPNVKQVLKAEYINIAQYLIPYTSKK